jgi:hypothetical protein
MGKSSISKWAEKSIDKVITSKPRPYQAILDDLFLLSKIEHASHKRRPSRSYDIPTKVQLQNYLAKNYSRIFVSRLTNKPVKCSGGNSIPHYFREE